MNIEGLSFEDAIRKLSEIAAELERGSADLERSLALYEEGIKLIRFCNKTLDEAQRKVKLLGINADGELTEGDFSVARDEK
ncbi:MAG: exodeoxyribonuclease VII small subunit [Clostridia bacterium]|nr:exodeoxyribonuclease VII small subunit [Clostridia bacterium]MBO7250505.1 exodeoxyribonuclease VII small subunit [Clostridia bacterium]